MGVCLQGCNERGAVSGGGGGAEAYAEALKVTGWEEQSCKVSSEGAGLSAFGLR